MNVFQYLLINNRNATNMEFWWNIDSYGNITAAFSSYTAIGSRNWKCGHWAFSFYEADLQIKNKSGFQMAKICPVRKWFESKWGLKSKQHNGSVCGVLLRWLSYFEQCLKNLTTACPKFILVMRRQGCCINNLNTVGDQNLNLENRTPSHYQMFWK